MREVNDDVDLFVMIRDQSDTIIRNRRKRYFLILYYNRVDNDRPDTRQVLLIGMRVFFFSVCRSHSWCNFFYRD